MAASFFAMSGTRYDTRGLSCVGCVAVLGVSGGVHHLLHVPAGSGMTRRPKEGQKSFGRDLDGIESCHFLGGLANSLVDATRNGMAERKHLFCSSGAMPKLAQVLSFFFFSPKFQLPRKKVTRACIESRRMKHKQCKASSRTPL